MLLFVQKFCCCLKNIIFALITVSAFVRFFNIHRQSEAYLCTNLNTYYYGEIYYQIGVANRAT